MQQVANKLDAVQTELAYMLFVWLDIWDVVGLKFCIALGSLSGCGLFCSLGRGGG